MRGCMYGNNFKKVIVLYVLFTIIFLSQFVFVSNVMAFDGDYLWGWDGLPVHETGSVQDSGQAVSDGNGGTIVVWVDVYHDVRAQRIDSNGNLLWGIDGKMVSDGADAEYSVAVSREGEILY